MTFFPRGHDLDLLQFRSTNSEIRGHLDNLASVNKIFWVGAKFLDAGPELAAGHALPNIEADRAFAVPSMVQTEFADRHWVLNLWWRRGRQRR